MPSADLRTQLYTKLWDNITSKDARVWTFVSFYGAALALFFGSSITPEFRLLGLPVILVIALWTLHIALSAEWWLARNQMMIVRLELDRGTKLGGKIPDFYQYPGYRADSVIAFGLLALSLIALIVFTYASFLVAFLSEPSPATAATAASVKTQPDNVQIQIQSLVSMLRPYLLVLLHGGAIFALIGVLSVREQQIDKYWQLAANFQKQHFNAPRQVVRVLTGDGPLTNATLKTLWAKDRRTFSLRGRAIFALLCVYGVALAPFLISYSSTNRLRITLSAIAFFIAIIAYAVSNNRYRAWIDGNHPSIIPWNLAHLAQSGFGWQRRDGARLMGISAFVFKVFSLLGIVFADVPQALPLVQKLF